jgi:2-methylcitrate dehydratase PrpD
VQAFIQRFKTVADDDPHQAAVYDRDDGSNPGYHVVELHTRDGRVLAGSVSQPRGGPLDPLSWDDLHEKYIDCAERALGSEAIERSAGMIRGLDELADVRDLTALLATD